MHSANRSYKPHAVDGPGINAGTETFTFECEGETLIGVIEGVDRRAAKGVLIVVGGPQYRAGSHRQFTLLSRQFAEHGVPTMRFDYRGMGDSSGEMRTFEGIEADLRAAVDTFVDRCPTLTEVVLWGLCDAASAICFYAGKDQRVTGVVLVNPWVRTVEGAAKARLKRYYLTRVLERDFWLKLKSGELRVVESLQDLWRTVRESRQRTAPRGCAVLRQGAQGALPDRMARGLDGFGGRVLMILCGCDLTADEFEAASRGSRTWRRILSRPAVTRHRLEEADHTFSRGEWRAQIGVWTLQWLASW